MCGRYTLTRPGDVLEETADALDAAPLARAAEDVHELAELLDRPRFNVAPTQRMPVVLGSNGDGSERPVLAAATWGVPALAGGRAPLINARSETVATLPTFAESFERRRCLVPADGFYEWRDRHPWRFTLEGGQGFCFAGLWDGGGRERTFCILTTEANATVAPIHDRMPVMLRGCALTRWLDPDATRGGLEALCRPTPADATSCWPVSPRVNRAGVEDPALIEPVAAPPENLSLF